VPPELRLSWFTAVWPSFASRRPPGRLQLIAALLGLGAIGFGAVAVHASGTRRQAVRSVASTEPVLVSAVELSASLSQVHAIAALGFLVPGAQPAASRRRYDRELRGAGAGVAHVASVIGTSSGTGAAIRRINRTLPGYAALIGEARANSRQGLPIASAYLRRASTAMADEMLPSARQLYKIEAQHLMTHYRAGVSISTTLVAVVAGCAVLGLLAAAQIWSETETQPPNAETAHMVSPSSTRWSGAAVIGTPSVAGPPPAARAERRRP
jgi:hypothetical protein